ncbi:hypothetical protein BEP19_10740 [Ammoniphilus oxalaticus]|uniref:N-acetyltransferase domain-containing protein n=1 Tax=Ammoniphilus oxalaticus TaxID=66863 RepID=A0A419SG09_9BACL|nr:hypothetical protein [Ammoniphilus oxalaticus]RKD22722.1 hypothetical protein BEP19_10740 [Ammoniphilus oxalaticus]
MSIIFRHTDNLHYIRSSFENKMGLLHRQFSEFNLEERLKRNQNYKIESRKVAIGFVSVRFEKRFLFLDLFVLDNKRQESQDFEKKVMQRLEREALKRNKHSIVTYAARHDQQMIAQYANYGFSITEQGRSYSVLEKSLQRQTQQSAQGRNKYLLIHFPL